MYKIHRVFFFLGAALLAGCFLNEEKKEEFKVPDALDYPPMTVPDDNPFSKKGVQLGRMLFYDPILSGDSTQSCASCHNQAFAFSDNGLQFSIGIKGEAGAVNASAIINAGWSLSSFWDGRAPSLEAQALGPVVNPLEMASTWPEVAQRLSSHSTYSKLFEDVFGTDAIDSMLVVKAIAQFERTLVSDNSKFDKVKRGEAQFTTAEIRGFETFFTERGDCFHCHVQNTFTDEAFHNNGIDSIIPSGSGRGGVTMNPSDDGKWKTPTLRNLDFTAPYMHDGRFETLEEVIDHYNSGVKVTSTVDPLVLKRSQGLMAPMTEEEKSNLIAFLKTLNDSSFITNPEFSNPH